ncbi:protein pxr1-like [Limosa lapponica baueri]|uniref:Protein pxr1-like n=1 Tax=Limosa lapponica baueri TaxID=1758121 RepID=A0A2I0U7H0_LIMLA|nr:protein pxr1-like [Limosa lapponica baueri]
MPASSKTDLPLAKAESISEGGSTSVKIYLRSGKKPAAQQQPGRGVRIYERNNSADTKVSEEKGGGGASGIGADIPLQLVVKIMVKQAVPTQIMEVHNGADIYCSPWRTPCWSRWMPEASCDPVGSPCWRRLLTGPAAPWREEPALQVRRLDL